MALLGDVRVLFIGLGTSGVSSPKGGGILCSAHCTLNNGFAVHLKAEPITLSSVDLLMVG